MSIDAFALKWQGCGAATETKVCKTEAIYFLASYRKFADPVLAGDVPLSILSNPEIPLGRGMVRGVNFSVFAVC